MKKKNVELRRFLDELRLIYHKRALAVKDPIVFLYRYDDPSDREIVALIASSLAYGRVSGILTDIEKILEGMNGASPALFVVENSRKTMKEIFSGFKHRFTTGSHIADMLSNAGSALRKYGSLNQCFMEFHDNNNRGNGTWRAEWNGTVIPAMVHFSRFLKGPKPDRGMSFLLPDPELGSACKRLNLFLRWMVRKDEIDPGGWSGISPAELVIPLDTHMHSIAIKLGLTKRKQADMKTALEITASLKKIDKDDPVGFDFALTRPGILGMKNRIELPAGA